MRKVLSFVLVLALVLSSFSMAFAADSAAGLTDIAGNANEDAIQVAYDLAIVTGNPDGTYLPDKTVTRAEFAAMITRSLAIPDSALAGYTATTFKDTAGYGWAVPYLAFAQSKGIMLGDGEGNAMPGRTITVNEAMTMALRAIGYTANSSLLVGAWPSNYVSIAQNESLYDDVAADTVVTKASAAQIIYNLLTVQKVAVNSDGETRFLEDSDGDAINLLNSNLGATEDDDVILGSAYDYDNSVINITGKIGAFGTAYINDDDDLIAFKVKSTTLTGKIDNGKFKVGDTKYEFDVTATDEAITFANTVEGGTDIDSTAGDIDTFATNNADDTETVTLNVKLSGKKIKDVYSVVAWEATQDDQAASDVQDDITDDQTLLTEEFALDDDDAIDLSQFQLVGVASLDDIAEDDVVYVYTDGDVIRKVAVGTDTVEGTVEETDDDTVTIDGENYDIAVVAGDQVLEIPGDIDVDSEGTFFLDSDGNVYAFDGTTKTADNFAVVKASYDSGNAYDGARVKLYLYDDSTDVLNFAEDDLVDLELTTISSISAITDIEGAMTTGSVIGYSLDSDGDIDALDLTASYGSVTVKSSKVLTFDENGTDYTIDANAAVFSYDAADGIDGGDYDVATVNDLEKETSAVAGIILNDDQKVVAIIVPSTAVDKDTDDVYGVFNKRTNTNNADKDPVYKFTGLIDGASFTKLTDSRSVADYAGDFGVYKIVVDTDGVITDVEDLNTVWNIVGGSYTEQPHSGIIAGAAVIASISSDKTVVTLGSTKYTIDDEAVVYKYDPNGGATKFTAAKLSNLKKDYTVTLYDTKGDDADGVATVVIFQED